MDEPIPKYRVIVWDLDKYIEAFLRLPESQQEQVGDLYTNHLPHRPRMVKPPMLKRLKGAQSHLYQFECGKGERLHYEVDDVAMEVRIVGLGKHMEWEKRGKSGG